MLHASDMPLQSIAVLVVWHGLGGPLLCASISAPRFSRMLLVALTVLDGSPYPLFTAASLICDPFSSLSDPQIWQHVCTKWASFWQRGFSLFSTPPELHLFSLMFVSSYGSPYRPCWRLADNCPALLGSCDPPTPLLLVYSSAEGPSAE
jgi:hypothetical protein